MKHILCSVLLLGGIVQYAHACDACGCSAASQNLGILPQFHRHFVGVQYQFKQLDSDFPSPFAGRPATHTTQYYNTMQVWGRYNVGKRLQVFGFLPYAVNTSREDEATSHNSGPGDASVMANAIVVSADSSDAPWKQTLLLGGGVKMPTGSNTGTGEMDHQGLPNIQTGTGSWDFLLNVNYTVRKGALGLNADATYTLTTANSYQYKYGNRLATGITGFYWWQAGVFTLLPQVGVRYEHTLHDYDNYGKKWLNDLSGGYMCFAAAGVQVYYGRLGFQSMLHLPVTQQYNAGYTRSKMRLETGLFILF